MISCTTERLDQLMGETHEPDRVFHYLPFNFAASWIVLLTYLTRETVLTLSTDLNKLADEIRLASPHYFLNVPTLLERVRRGVEEALSKRPAMIRSFCQGARRLAAPACGSRPCVGFLARLSAEGLFSAKSKSASARTSHADLRLCTAFAGDPGIF
jgi:long-subunit acyl-CoA synthetase (AMP-forming)